MRFFNTDGVFYQYEKEKDKLPWSKIGEVLLTVVFLAGIAGFMYQFIASKIDENRFKVRGSMISAGDYRLFTNVTGNGNFAVVFESGTYEPYQEWDKIKEKVSDESIVFTYERAGHGWSDKAASSKDMSRAVDDLKAVLKKSAAKSPYILVGEGYGGLIMQKFAEEYPNDTAGMVLIDSWTEDYIKSQDFKRALRRDAIKYGAYEYSSYLGVTRILEQLNILPEDKKLMADLPGDAAALYRTHSVTSKFNGALYDELKALEDYKGSIDLNGILGDKPVYVLTSDNHGFSEEKEQQWVQWQKSLLQLSTKAELVTVEDAGTYMPMENTQEVANVINAVIEKVGKNNYE